MALQDRERVRSTKERLQQRGITKSGGGRGNPPRLGSKKYRYTGAEMYLRYTLLEVGVLGHILESLEEIKQDVVPQVEKETGQQLEKPTVLFIRNMYTGQSITFNLAGTTVTIDSKKQYMIAVLVIGMLYTAFKIYNDFKLASVQIEKTNLENEEKKIDIELKKIDLEKKKAIWENEKDTAAGKLASYLIENKNITAVRLNRVLVK